MFYCRNAFTGSRFEQKINQLLAGLATQVPFKPNVLELAKTIGMGRASVGYRVDLAKKGDFVIDGTYTFGCLVFCTDVD